MTLPDPSHPAYAVPCRAEPVAEPAAPSSQPAAAVHAEAHTAARDEMREARVQLYLALRARDGRPFAAAYTASVERVAAPAAPVAPDRAQLSLFGATAGSSSGR